MTILERAQAHWDSRPSHEMEVAEWGEGAEPLILCFKTPNASTLSKVVRESKGDPIEQAARLVVACATDRNGDRLFSPADSLALMKHVDPSVVSRIAARIMEEAHLDVGQAEKNSEAIPS
jgi:hypothetical protein